MIVDFEEGVQIRAAQYIAAIAADYPDDPGAQYAVVRQMLLVKEQRMESGLAEAK